MPGELVEDSVIIHDSAEASTIYNKGCYGYPVSGGGLELDLMEASYLVESSRLQVTSAGKLISLEDLVRAASLIHRDFEIDYTVYRDLRQRGYIVKAGGEFNFRLFPRGGTPSNSQTKSWVMSVSERATFQIKSLVASIEQAEQTRKELLTGVVDEEGDITYYHPVKAEPKGNVNVRWEGNPAVASLMEDRVLVFDQESAEKLQENGYYGKQTGTVLQLSLIEAAHLMEKGWLEVVRIASNRRLNVERFKKRAVKFQPDFDLRLAVYNDLRSRSLIVKTGFKYGSHFRVYDDDPDKTHARWLVHSIPLDYETIWPEMSRAVRLAHGVKKEILFARVLPQDIEYIKLTRVRP
ncbi:tRNA-intron lyase [Candidatus Methanomassiliicoccus intestinalis]|uniref:tRNA-intron lyase n=1 Tax=Candidatus Methanomassiliicoccus intestinalis TaxID=1406512 RepID=UPI0037DDAFDC